MHGITMPSTGFSTPLQRGALALKNRVAMAPMTRSRATDDGVPRPIVADYYAQRAAAGLIVSEGVSISPGAQGFPNIPGLFNDAQQRAWQDVTRALQGTGTRFFLQLWHVGRVSHPCNLPPGLHPVAPSAIPAAREVMTRQGLRTAPVPRALETAEVLAVVQDYARAAERALAAGCDGVEIHAANGYLPAQFLHQSSNQREDAWGGDIPKRARFTIAVAQACADVIGAERVGVRISPFSNFNGATSSDEAALYTHLIDGLAALKLAYLHAVHTEAAPIPSDTNTGAVDVIGFARARWPGVLVAAGGFDPAKAARDLAAGRADVVAFGRDFIGNPDLPERLFQGLPLAERSSADWYGSDARGYTDYPTLVPAATPRTAEAHAAAALSPARVPAASPGGCR